MAEELVIATAANKNEKYQSLLPQIETLIIGERNMIANMANVAAALKQTFDFLWVGFYLVEEDELVLGPFQGPIACTRIKKGNGVCGKAWEKSKTIIVPDVDLFPGHIACSSASRSEIVLPIFNRNREIIAVLDVDSNQLSDFDHQDQEGLEAIINLLQKSTSA